MNMSNSIYDFLNKSQRKLIPFIGIIAILAVKYFEVPCGELIVGLIQAIALANGINLDISSKNYHDAEDAEEDM